MTKLRVFVAEFIGTFALIFVGVAAINAAKSDLLAIALAHGLTIAVMASATGHISGGHLNPAVTFGALIANKLKPDLAVLYILAQLAGAVSAGLLARVLFSAAVVQAGTPNLAPDVGAWVGIAVEAVLTFFLVFVVFGTGIDGRGPKIGGLAIGLTVALDILAGGPVTGAAVNPARTFGPALAVGFWSHHAVYWIGPLLGGGLAGALYGHLFLESNP